MLGQKNAVTTITDIISAGKNGMPGIYSFASRYAPLASRMISHEKVMTQISATSSDGKSDSDWNCFMPPLVEISLRTWSRLPARADLIARIITAIPIPGMSCVTMRKRAHQRIDQPKLGCGGFGFRHDSVRRIGGGSGGGNSSGVTGSAKSYGSAALEMARTASLSLVGKELSSAAM